MISPLAYPLQWLSRRVAALSREAAARLGPAKGPHAQLLLAVVGVEAQNPWWQAQQAFLAEVLARAGLGLRVEHHAWPGPQPLSVAGSSRGFLSKSFVALETLAKGLALVRVHEEVNDLSAVGGQPMNAERQAVHDGGD